VGRIIALLHIAMALPQAGQKMAVCWLSAKQALSRGTLLLDYVQVGEAKNNLGPAAGMARANGCVLVPD
jgi:hypothetical protein